MTASRPVAAVTGGRRGIGRAIALALAKAGFDLVVNDLVRDEAAEATLADLAALGAEARFAAGDVADLDGRDGLADALAGALGRLHCFVSNAGVSVLQRGDLLDVSPASFDRVVDVNLRGTFFLAQAVARRMTGQPADGHPRTMIFITSANAAAASIERGEYCMAKAGVSMMARLFALRLAPRGITVHEVRPGVIRTDMTAPATEKYDRLFAEGLAPIARWGEPEDVGRAVAALASGAFGYVTGGAVCVDGGMHIERF